MHKIDGLRDKDGMVPDSFLQVPFVWFVVLVVSMLTMFQSYLKKRIAVTIVLGECISIRSCTNGLWSLWLC